MQKQKEAFEIYKKLLAQSVGKANYVEENLEEDDMSDVCLDGHFNLEELTTKPQDNSMKPTLLFDHPKTRIHQSHAVLLRLILAVIESDQFPSVKLAAIETIARKGLDNGG